MTSEKTQDAVLDDLPGDVGFDYQKWQFRRMVRRIKSYLPSFWKGYLTGTNRAKVWVRMSGPMGARTVRAVLNDQAFGPALVLYREKNQGPTGVFRLLEFFGLPSNSPLDGEAKISILEDTKSATGEWRSDIGTHGVLSLTRLNFWRSFWLFPAITALCKLLWLKYAAVLYAVLLIVVALLSVHGVGHISYPALILLLLPIPFLFQNRIAWLIHQLRIRKAGPLEFDAHQSEMVNTAPGPANYPALTETEKFSFLDVFFVPMTKFLVIWIGDHEPVPIDRFFTFAAQVGVVGQNLRATLDAMTTSECVRQVDMNLRLSEFGRRYMEHLRSPRIPIEVARDNESS